MKAFKQRVTLALQMSRKEIFEAIQKYIFRYYKEMTPIIYSRIWKFLNSLIQTEVVMSGNTLSCTVEIDETYLNYTYSGGATGLEVATWANDHSHGGKYDSSYGRFFDDAIDELGGKPGIYAIMERNLKKCGIPIA